jgi:hypothetical protein
VRIFFLIMSSANARKFKQAPGKQHARYEQRERSELFICIRGRRAIKDFFTERREIFSPNGERYFHRTARDIFTGR